jgi:hypothetical protein
LTENLFCKGKQKSAHETPQEMLRRHSNPYHLFSNRNRKNQAEASFIITRPLTIKTAATTRIRLAGSPRKMIPTANAPTAPMPVQIV